MVRLWYKTGDYMDVPRGCAWEYEADPEWDRSEDIDDEANETKAFRELLGKADLLLG